MRDARLTRVLTLLLAFLAVPASAFEDKKPYNPKISEASDEAEKAQKGIRLASGLSIELVAAEPMLANPVSFYVDNSGKIYVAETFRHTDGATDNREHMYWLDDELACKTVEDRIAMFKKHLGENVKSYEDESDRVRLLVDKDGDGKIDTSTVFAEGFNAVPDGIGAGLLAYKGDVYYTCIPKLWKLKDTNGDGVADKKEALHHGYGVHVAFIGHDLHGLRIGPDGKLYFSIGDRGLNIVQDGRKISNPDTGAVLRCNLDGSDLEVFATGLRNPQELVFDQYGHLFTADNNSDGGDKARFVHVVEGTDSGWRLGYQYHEGSYSRGPWNAEKMWYPRWDGQAAYIWPPIENLGDGPSGLTYDPGVSSLPQAYKNHFFLCDFRGASGQSGIRSFALERSKAGYKLIDSTQPIWAILATDVDFGPDGSLYVSDWVEGWPKPGKGRIWKVFGATGNPQINDTKLLLANGLRAQGRSNRFDFLRYLLTHPDQRVRQEAQFELVASKEISTLASVLPDAKLKGIAQLHAIWGIGQLARANHTLVEDVKLTAGVLAALNSDDLNLREVTATMLGEVRWDGSSEALIARLKDEEPMVAMAAAIALGKLKKSDAVDPILDMIEANKDESLYIRHGGVQALKSLASDDRLAKAANSPSKSVRMATLLAYRLRENAAVGKFLSDAEPSLVLEAARAVNDLPIDGSPMNTLASMTESPNLSGPLGRRVVNANIRIGGVQGAKNLAKLLTIPNFPESLKAEALAGLASWAKPQGRDRVTGLWRPIAERPATDAANALAAVLPGLFDSPELPSAVRIAALEAAGSLNIRDAGPQIVKQANDTKLGDRDRIAALKALESLDDPRLVDAAKLALTDKKPRYRSEGLRVIAKLEPAKALPILGDVLLNGSINDRQAALTILGDVKDPEADALLSKSLDVLIAGKAPAEVELDLLESAAKHPSLSAKLADFDKTRSKDDPLAPWRECLSGGDSTKGRDIFFNKAAVQCMRCHKASGRGGEVGPVLDTVASKNDRRYLLESIVRPNAKIAEGFETVIVAKTDGQVVTGVLKSQDDKELKLMTADAKAITIPKSEIDEQKRGDSAMPTDLLKNLSKSEIRDLVEWLSTLKGKTTDHGK